MSIKLPTGINESVALALAEDVGAGDVTANLIDRDTNAKAKVITREFCILCGTAWFDEVFQQLDPAIKITWMHQDGDECAPDSQLCTIEGNARKILTGERAALNFLQTLSATATTTHAYASELASSKTEILDTRKTIPGLRLAQKYAVTIGGGSNHRIGLYDQVLIKENHIVACGSIKSAVHNARELYNDLKIEVETENLDEFEQALAAEADIIMLDNFSLEDMRTAVECCAGKSKLEVSGNVTIESLTAIAATGVDYISSGALTKNINSIDLSMRFSL